MATAAAKAVKTFKIEIAEQVKDDLVNSQELIDYLRSKMKVKNSVALAERVLNFTDKTTEVELSTEEGNVIKKNLKLYLKRFLRSKDLRNFIRVSGKEDDVLKFEYVNKVDDEE